MRESLIGDRTEFRVLVYDDTTQKTYYSEEIEPGKYTTTDAKLTEAVTERNNLVSEKLGIDVKAVYTDDVTTTMRQEMLAPSGTFDAAMPFLNGCATLAQEGALYDLREFEEQGIIDLSAPWYDQNANESLSIQNKIYFTVSDMSIMQKVVSIAMTYNPDLLATKYPDLDLLELVNNGEWTFDKLYEIGREFADDTNGDGTMDYNNLGSGLRHRRRCPLLHRRGRKALHQGRKRQSHPCHRQHQLDFCFPEDSQHASEQQLGQLRTGSDLAGCGRLRHLGRHAVHLR